jgi:hypothetical protein
MGQAIAAAAQKADIDITAALDLGDDASKHISACDVVIDFSSPNATEALCAACREAGKPAVIGTTGHSMEQRASIEELAASVPLVLSELQCRCGTRSLVNAKGGGNARQRFRSRGHRNASSLEKGCAERNCEEIGRNFVRAATSITGRTSGTPGRFGR